MSGVDVWKPVVGYEGFYEVSSLGQIRGVTRQIEFMRCGKLTRHVRKGKILKLRVMDLGYVMVQLSRDGIVSGLLVHRLVAEAFIGPCPEGLECGHSDHNRSHNASTNLSWITPKENQNLRVENGTSNRADRAHQRVLSSDDVRDIRRRMKVEKRIGRKLAKEYGVHLSTIHYANKGKNWASVA